MTDEPSSSQTARPEDRVAESQLHYARHLKTDVPLSSFQIAWAWMGLISTFVIAIFSGSIAYGSVSTLRRGVASEVTIGPLIGAAILAMLFTFFAASAAISAEKLPSLKIAGWTFFYLTLASWILTAIMGIAEMLGG